MPHRCWATGSASSAPAWWAAAWRGCWPGSPAFRSRSSTPTPAGRTSPTLLGVEFALPAEAADVRDLVIHTSATSQGLQRSLELIATEGTVIELSWYGDAGIAVSLGGAFHPRRLAIRASHVGMVSPARRGQRTPANRLALALDLLRDPAFDTLITGVSRFDELPEVIARLADGSLPALCHTVSYGDTEG
jgi:hypothetical protein